MNPDTIELEDLDNELITEMISQLPHAQTLFLRALKQAGTPQGVEYRPYIQVTLIRTGGLEVVQDESSKKQQLPSG